MKDDLEFLKNVPILSDLQPMDLDTISKVGVRKKYKKGSIILLEEEAGAALFVIVSGKVKIVRMDDDGREVDTGQIGGYRGYVSFSHIGDNHWNGLGHDDDLHAE